MPRVVLTGSPGALYRPTKADLPEDGDARDAFLRYVDLSGLDLSKFDLRNSDILDCDARGVILPADNRTDYMQSRRTNWRNAVIPADVSSYNHDLVVECYRQLNPNHPVLKRVIARVGDGLYDKSWRDSIFDVMQGLGVTKQQALDSYRLSLLGKRPKLLDRLKQHVRDDDIRQAPPSTRRPLDAYPASGGETLDLSAFDFGVDRYECSRRLEREFPAYWFYVGQLDPWPIILTISSDRVVGEPRRDWWTAAWPS